MKRVVTSIEISLDYPDNGKLYLTKTGESHSISTTDGLVWRQVYQADDRSFWMKLNNVWTEVTSHPTGYLVGKRKCDMRRSFEDKERDRQMYESIQNGGFNPLAGL